MEFKKINFGLKEKKLFCPEPKNRELIENIPKTGLIIPEIRNKNSTFPSPLNQNRISYVQHKHLNENKLITPVVNKAYFKRMDLFSVREKFVNMENGPFTPKSKNSSNQKDCLNILRSNHDPNIFKKSKNKNLFFSPTTNYSIHSGINPLINSHEKLKSFSRLQSPNPLNFMLQKNFETTQFTNSNFFDKNKFNHVSNYLINPLTNNNLNIFNLIDNKEPQISKRDLNVFNSFNSNEIVELKQVKSTESLQKISRPQKISKFNWGCKEPLNLQIALSKNCKKCDCDQVKEKIYNLMTELKSNQNCCIKLSFDNFMNNEKDSKILKKEPKRKESLLEKSDLVCSESFDLVKNIVWNSFLRNKKSVFKNQLEEIIKKMMNKLKNNEKLIYHKVNVFTLINLQVPMCNKSFHSLSNSVKLRVICMLFAKYVNRKPFVNLCTNFSEQIDFSNESRLISYLYT